MKVHVYYEDSRTAGGDFTLHDLVLACVADRVSGDRWAMRADVTHTPMRGNSKLLRACKADVERLKCARVAAVLDGDELAALLNLSGTYCKREARAAFSAIATDSRLELFVLDRNIETLIETLGRLEPDLSPLLTLALNKDRDARDRVFANAASGPRGLRDRLCAAVPSFDRLVGRIADWQSSQAGALTGGAP